MKKGGMTERLCRIDSLWRSLGKEKKTDAKILSEAGFRRGRDKSPQNEQGGGRKKGKVKILSRENFWPDNKKRKKPTLPDAKKRLKGGKGASDGRNRNSFLGGAHAPHQGAAKRGRGKEGKGFCRLVFVNKKRRRCDCQQLPRFPEGGERVVCPNKERNEGVHKERGKKGKGKT